MGLITLVPPTLACNKYKEGEGARNGVIMHHWSAGAGGTAALVRPPLPPPPTAPSTPSSLFWHGGGGRCFGAVACQVRLFWDGVQ